MSMIRAAPTVSGGRQGVEAERELVELEQVAACRGSASGSRSGGSSPCFQVRRLISLTCGFGLRSWIWLDVEDKQVRRRSGRRRTTGRRCRRRSGRGRRRCPARSGAGARVGDVDGRDGPRSRAAIRTCSHRARSRSRARSARAGRSSRGPGDGSRGDAVDRHQARRRAPGCRAPRRAGRAAVQVQRLVRREHRQRASASRSARDAPGSTCRAPPPQGGGPESRSALSGNSSVVS